MNFTENKIFIDTWGWLTLRDKSEKKHHEVTGFIRKCLSRNILIYTTDYILDETFTLLFKRLSFSKAENSFDLIRNAMDKGEFQLEWITPERFYQTCEFRQKFRDKPEISFTDLSSMVVMQELKIRHILTEDAHFIHVNLGFQPLCG